MCRTHDKLPVTVESKKNKIAHAMMGYYTKILEDGKEEKAN